MTNRFAACLIAAALCLAQAAPPAAGARKEYRYVDLGASLPEGVYSYPYSISSKGEVAGGYYDPYGGEVPTVWYPSGKAIPLGLVPGSSSGTAWGVNRRGFICGFGWDGVGSRGIYYAPGEAPLDMGRPEGATYVFPLGISDKKLVVGYLYAPAEETSYPVTWKPGADGTGVWWVSSYPGLFSSVNPAGHIVGTFGPDGYLFKRKRSVRIPVPEGFTSLYPAQVNSKDQVVGYIAIARPDGSFRDRPFFWEKGKLTRLPLPDGADRGYCAGLNARGKVVGAVRSDSGWKAVVWTRAGKRWRLAYLEDLVARPDDWPIEYVAGIDDRGRIIGSATAGGYSRAFLLAPR
jgi:uncharacterized membrane protein